MGDIKAFLEEDQVCRKLMTLSQSPLASYKNPTNVFPHLANILTVAMQEKWGSENVYKKYREWCAQKYPILEISLYLDKAMKNIQSKQYLITDFYSPENGQSVRISQRGE